MDTVYLAQPENLETLRTRILKISNIQYVNVTWSSLGGVPSIFIKLSLDSKDDWMNGIFYNSNYSVFAIHEDCKLEQITRHFKLPKFRKSKLKSIDDIVDKVQKWVNKI